MIGLRDNMIIKWELWFSFTAVEVRMSCCLFLACIWHLQNEICIISWFSSLLMRSFVVPIRLPLADVQIVSFHDYVHDMASHRRTLSPICRCPQFQTNKLTSAIISPGQLLFHLVSNLNNCFCDYSTMTEYHVILHGHLSRKFWHCVILISWQLA